MKIDHIALYCLDLEGMREFFIRYFNGVSNEKVDSLTEVLTEDSYHVLSGSRTTGDVYYESCIVGPEKILIEITI